MIYLRPLSGLCNRLRTIAAGVKLSQEIGCRLCIHWRVDGSMNARYGDLFLPSSNFCVYDCGATNLYSRIRFFRRLPCVFVHDERQRFLMMARKFGKMIPVAYSDYEDFVDSRSYDWMRPLPDIVDEVESEKQKWDTRPTIALHVRRTDNEQSILHSPIEGFERAVEAEIAKDDGASFFLATDDPSVKRRLADRFGTHIKTRENVRARNECGGVRDALIDLLLLASCPKIYGSYYSSFSEVAAFIGKSELRQITDLGK